MPNVGDIIRAEDFKTNGGFIGQIIEFPSNLIPSNVLLCDGSEISRDTYSELFNVIGTIYGEGDGSTTFNIPDYRGAFLRCTGGNADVLGTLQEDAIRNISGQCHFRPYKGTISDTNNTLFNSPVGAFTKTLEAGGSSEGVQGVAFHSPNQILMFNASNVVPTAEENRPINYSVNICIIYE